MKNQCCSLQSSCFFSFSCNSLDNNKNVPLPIGSEFLSKGAHIWYNHDADCHHNNLYIIRSGVLVCMRYSMNGEMNSYLLLGKGQTIGEMCLFTSNKVPFVVTALTDVELCKIDSDYIEKLVLEKPMVSRFIFNAIIKNVCAILDYSDMLETKSAYDRIKRILMMLVESIGETDREVNLALTHKDLAFLVYSNRVTVTKTLHQLEDEGFVKMGNRNIIVRTDYDSEREFLYEKQLNILV